MQSTRFDYVRYDKQSQHVQSAAKDMVQKVETLIEGINCFRSRMKALDALEECYMWIGKGLRNDQVALRGAELQEERSDE